MDNANINLLPCPVPWCKGLRVHPLSSHDKRSHWVRCAECDLESPDCETPEEAAKVWNQRDVAPLPLCAVHQNIEDRKGVEIHYGNDCIACSLNERKELLGILSQDPTYNPADDSVTALVKAITPTLDPLSELERLVVEAAVIERVEELRYRTGPCEVPDNWNALVAAENETQKVVDALMRERKAKQ